MSLQEERSMYIGNALQQFKTTYERGQHSPGDGGYLIVPKLTEMYLKEWALVMVRVK